MFEKNVADAAARLGAGERPGELSDETAAGAQSRAEAWLLLLLAGYGLAYLFIRQHLSGALELDEAEIVYLVQELRAGYGTQPPLYAWLQWLSFSAFGLNLYGLLLPKIALLMASYGLMYRAARALLGMQGALAAAAALALFPQIGWESLRIQTHSVLVTTLACATLWCYFALLARPSLGRWLVLGLLCGLGLQAKYNFACFLAGLAGASLLVPAHRRVLWNRGTAPAALLAALLALLVLLPHAAWMVQHPDAAFAGTVRKMQDGMGQGAYLRRVAVGMGNVLSSLAAFALLPALLFAVLAWPVRARLRIDRQMPTARWFLFLHGIFLALLCALALTGEVGTIKDRWMIPLFFSLPLAAFVILPALRTRRAYAWVWRTGLAVALAYLTVLPVRYYLGVASDKPATAHHPYAALAQALRQRCPAAATVVTEGLLPAGNLRFANPAWRTVLLGGNLGDALPAGGQAILVTHARAGTDTLARFRAAHPDAVPLRQERLRLRPGRAARATMAFDMTCFALGSR